MENLDARKPAEIVPIEGEDRAGPVGVCRSDQPRVVNLHTRDGVDHDQLPPEPINFRRLRQQIESRFDPRRYTIGNCGIKSESVSLPWSRAHTPEFDDILRNDAGSIASLSQCLQRVTGLPIAGIPPVDPPN